MQLVIQSIYCQLGVFLVVIISSFLWAVLGNAVLRQSV